VADVSLGEAYLKEGATKLPVEVICLDPMNRLANVQMEIWTGNAGTVRPPALVKPGPVAGDGPRQAITLAYQNNKAVADIELPAMKDGQTFWLQPMVTDKTGRTHWSTASAHKVSDFLPVERKAAELHLQMETQPERTLKLMSSNKVLIYQGNKAISV